MIVIVEDNRDINNMLSEFLNERGYETCSLYTGLEAKLFIQMNDFDLMLLDLMLPSVSGEEIIKFTRHKGINAPIIVLSAKLDKETRLSALSSGADDYIVKPFDMDEVLTRIEVQLRRAALYDERSEDFYVYGDFTINTNEASINFKGENLSLTKMEYMILKTLIYNPKRLYSKESLYREAQNDDYYVDENTISVHISNIRQKLKKVDKNSEYIKTVWGIGYRLEP